MQMDGVCVKISCSVIVVAAGSSRRMGFDKLAASLAGMPVLRRTVEAFLAVEGISEIIVVGPEARWQLLEGMKFTTPVRRVDGGATRQESVAAGLAEITSDYVAVHDGARPLISPADISDCMKAAFTHRAVALARRVTETLKRSDADDWNADPVSREHLWFMETPQFFQTKLLREAYLEARARGLRLTDEVSAIEANGGRVKFIESRHPNLKITTPADLALAEAYLI